MRRLIRWALLIAAIITGAYFLTAGAETRSTRAQIPRPPVVELPINPGAPSFADAASRGVRELFVGNPSLAWSPRTGLWGRHTRPNWWQSALILQTLVRYLERTDNLDPFYESAIEHIYEHNVYKPLSTAKRNFANEFMDDTAWWGLAWLEASRYELYYRHDRAEAAKFLAVAEYDERYIVDAPRQCGGIVWALRRAPDMVTSAEFIALAAKLSSYLQAPGVFHDAAKADQFLTDARYVLHWLEHSGMVDVSWGYVLDRINGGCHDFVGGPLTYTEGEMADALTQMGIATHQPIYFKQAGRFIRHVLNYKSGFVAHGVLQERCEALSGACRHNRNRLDIPAWKGIFIQAVADWRAATHRPYFLRFLRNQAAAVVDNAVVTSDNRPANCASPETCQFAFIWGRQLDPGPPPVPVTAASQESAIDALTAVLPPKPHPS
ncbi:MAG: glycoside hydrolase family 76 protein [Candidatus Woesearchaeota archaeon]